MTEKLKDAIVELERFSAILDSDPERILNLSEEELTEEMKEIGLDPAKPLPPDLVEP